MNRREFIVGSLLLPTVAEATPIIGFSRAASNVCTVLTPGSFTFAGARVDNTGDVNLGGSPGDVAQSWNQEIIDTNTFHDTVTTNSRMTIPSAVNGQVGVLQASIYNSHSSNPGEIMQVSFRKNGSASWDGCAAQQAITSFNTQNMCSIMSAPFRLVTADFYEVFIFPSGATNNTTKLYCTFSIFIISLT